MDSVSDVYSRAATGMVDDTDDAVNASWRLSLAGTERTNAQAQAAGVPPGYERVPSFSTYLQD